MSAKGAEPVELESFGAVSITALSNDKELQLAPGKKLRIRLPCPSPCVVPESSGQKNEPDSVPLWSLDENTGLWAREGAGRIVREEGKTPYVEAELPHLSSWNCDFPIEQKSTILVQGVRDSAGHHLDGMTLLAEGLDYAGYTFYYDKSDWNYGADETSGGTCIEVRPRSRIRLKVRAWSGSRLYEAEREIETGPPGLSCAQAPPFAGTVVNDIALSESPRAETLEFLALNSLRKSYRGIETIQMRDGRVIRGSVISDNQKLLIVRTAGGVRYLPVPSIQSITYN
jgi:hypothetical protein